MPTSNDPVLHDLLRGLTESLIEGELSVDDEGRAAFAVSDELIVTLDHLPETNQIVLHAELGFLAPGPEAQTVLRDLLLDTLGLATSWGGALGVDRETGTVALFARRSAAGLEQSAFEDWLGEIADAGEGWQRRLNAAQTAASDGPRRR